MSSVHRKPSAIGKRSLALALCGGLTLSSFSIFTAASQAVAEDVVDLSSASVSLSSGVGSVGESGAGDITFTDNALLRGTAIAGRSILVRGGSTAKPIQITLEGASISAGTDSNAAFQVLAGSIVEITLKGTNTLTGSSLYPALGIEAPDSVFDQKTRVTIKQDPTNSGVLNASSPGTAAAIGGNGTAELPLVHNRPFNAQNIANRAKASCGGDLFIQGGTINATATGSGSAIGGGRFGDGCPLTISGGVVNATASAAAGIGGGIGQDGQSDYATDSPGGNGGTVSISGGTVTASSATSDGSAAIGGGRGALAAGPTFAGTDGTPGTLAITGGSVKLTPETHTVAPSLSALGLVKINNVPGVSSVKVTGQGSAEQDFKISANHSTDNTLYLYLPPKSYTFAVATATVPVAAFEANVTSAGTVVATPVATTSPDLVLTAPTFPEATVGAAIAPQSLTVKNNGDGAATGITFTSSNPSFTVSNGPTTLAAGASGSVTVTPSASLAANSYTTVITASYNGKTAKATVSLTVKKGADVAKAAADVAAVETERAGLDAAKYTPESVKALDDAIAAAKAVVADGKATQAQLDVAVAAVAAAKAALKAVDVVQPPVEPPVVQITAPSAVKISKVTAAKKKVTVKWAKAAAAQKVTGYQVSYKVKGASKWTVKTVKGAAKVSLTVKKLKKGKAYQVRVRVYKTVDGKSYYSKYSATKTSKKVK